MFVKIFNDEKALSFNNFSFIYGVEKSQKPAVSDINFELKKGEILILAGPSGSGKSTLSYAINGIIPWRLKGMMKGDVKVFGKSVWDYNFMELSRIVGLVKQNPLDQLVSFRVRDEIAFGLENLKYPEKVITEKVEEIANFMGIAHLLDREIDQLSGGQKQLTILCSFLVMNPKILILDEPIAFLDQHSESLLLDRLKRLIKSPDYNLSLIIIEHRLSRVINFADKILVLDDNGTIKLKGSISETIRDKFEALKACNVRVPWIIDVFNNFKKINPELVGRLEFPTNFKHLLELTNKLNKEELTQIYQVLIDTEIKPKNIEKFETYDQKISFDEVYIESFQKKYKIEDKSKSGENDSIEGPNTILETKNLCFVYPNSGIKAIDDLSIKIKQGDFIGLVGPNGSGKTTLLYLLANLYEPTSGDIFYKNQNLKVIDHHQYSRKIGFIFQNPENMIFKRTIREEILYGPTNFGIKDEINEKYISKLIELIGNESENKNPFNLSWGQKRRLNLSSIFVYNPDIILLDEPFIGQDQKTIDSLVETLYIENKRGKTIIISSHDYHLLLKYTRKIIELNKDGSLNNNGNYFLRHKNLGPLVLLNSIKKKLGDALN
ncbi:MAG: ABC transporter ATP-binding protein [Candidatus Hodarchaeota archaeon]